MRPALLAFAAYSALTIWFTWPLAVNPGGVIPNDVGDPVLNTWILWWNAFHWPLTPSWWNAPIFFPAHHTMAFSEHLIGLTPIAAPAIWLSGNPLLGYNVSFLLSFALSATAAYLLVFELTERRDAAFLAGLAFGFAPYRVAQWAHLQVLMSFWMPIALLGLHRFLGPGGFAPAAPPTRSRGSLVFLITGRYRWLWLFFAAFVMQALSNGYYLAFFSVLVGLWVVWHARSLRWRRTAAVVAAWLAGIAAMLPILLTYRAVHAEYGLTRNLENARLYSADVAGWLSASPYLRLWSGLPAYGTQEGMLFTGVTVIALMLAGAVVTITGRGRVPPAPAGSSLAFYAIAALALYALALGPSPSLFGERLDMAGPYALLTGLPGFASLRAPARFGMLVALCVAIGAAIGYARLSHSWSARRRAIFAVVFATAIAAESWPRELPLWEPPRSWDLEADNRSPLLVLPILNEFNEAASMYRSMSHHRPLVNGYSGHIPPWYMPLMEALNDRDPAVFDELARAGVRHVAVINRSDPDKWWREFVATKGTVVRDAADGTFTLFELRPAETRAAPGAPLPTVAVHATTHAEITAALLDDNAETWWSTLGAQAGGEDLILDLGSEMRVAGVEMELSRNGFEFPRVLDIAVSTDSRTWSGVWRGAIAGLTVGAVMRNPSGARLQFTFGEQSARFVRVRQTGRHRTASWTVSRLRALGPSRP